MEADFLANFLVVHIGKEIAENFSTDNLIDNFYLLKEQQLISIIMNVISIFVVCFNIKLTKCNFSINSELYLKLYGSQLLLCTSVKLYYY